MSLFLGQLPSNVNETIIRREFSVFGPLLRCDYRGRIAFVTFEQRTDAEKAMEHYQTKEFEGKK